MGTGSISQINATPYALDLNNISDRTILSLDRPNRIITSVSTADIAYS